MIRALNRASLKASQRFGVLLAMLALMMQLAVSTLGMPSVPAQADFSAELAATICHVDTGPVDQNHTPARHHAPDCDICPICQAISHAHLLLTPPLLVLAAPMLLALGLAAPGLLPSLHSHTAPPAKARGPPPNR